MVLAIRKTKVSRKCSSLRCIFFFSSTISRMGREDGKDCLNRPLNPNEDVEIIGKEQNLEYSIYFLLGAGFLFPWNTFITAIDYFSYIYPAAHVNRAFALTYMGVKMLFSCVLMAGGANRCSNRAKINLGWVAFLVSLIIVMLVDAFYVNGERGVYGWYYVTLVASGLCGFANALFEGSLLGHARQLPGRTMQALVAGSSASGVIMSATRIITKVMCLQDPHGLRRSANIYFGTSIAMALLCLVCYNIVSNNLTIRSYKGLKLELAGNERIDDACGPCSTEMLSQVGLPGFGMFLTCTITYTIFPGHVTEDLYSGVLKVYWFPVLLISCYNVFDLIGKSLTAFYVVESVGTAVASAFGRFLFFPLFRGCLHGPEFFKSEILVAALTCLLGLTHGYLTSIFLIMSPKVAGVERPEITGIAMVMFLMCGNFFGSALSWLWII